MDNGVTNLHNFRILETDDENGNSDGITRL